MVNRKDDPVFNVKFVQCIESKPCLWNSTLSAYNRKDEIQKAWLEVANETKDTVRNCRERWRTIRSSFLRSIKLTRNSSGHKRKYYLSKYLQFLLPYTRARRKDVKTNWQTELNNSFKGDDASSLAIAPITFISNMPMPANSKEFTKDLQANADAGDDVMVSPQEDAMMISNQASTSSMQPSNDEAADGALSAATICSADLQLNGNLPSNEAGSSNAVADLNFLAELMKCKAVDQTQLSQAHSLTHPFTHSIANSSLRISCSGNPISSHLNQQNSFPGMHFIQIPDAEQSFLNSLHPFLKEMTGKQNRRFRQKVVALIDAILDNTD